MSSLYFALNKTGYQLETSPLTISTDHSKRIPVYKVISEPMNLKPKT